MSFTREERYIVIKISDLQNTAVSQDSIDNLIDLEESVAVYRKLANKPPLVCAVIEQDWPEYDKVWKMIEERVNEQDTRPDSP